MEQLDATENDGTGALARVVVQMVVVLCSAETPSVLPLIQRNSEESNAPRTHSMLNPLSPTRGGLIVLLSMGVRPLSGHSLTPFGASIEV